MLLYLMFKKGYYEFNSSTKSLLGVSDEFYRDRFRASFTKVRNKSGIFVL